jgi:hypothetical protein
MTAYASINFKTKKALKEAVQRGERITVRSITPMGTNQVTSGKEAIAGPWYPEPHKWYAQVVITDGKITSVK